MTIFIEFSMESNQKKCTICVYNGLSLYMWKIYLFLQLKIPASGKPLGYGRVSPGTHIEQHYHPLFRVTFTVTIQHPISRVCRPKTANINEMILHMKIEWNMGLYCTAGSEHLFMLLI